VTQNSVMHWPCRVWLSMKVQPACCAQALPPSDSTPASIKTDVPGYEDSTDSANAMLGSLHASHGSTHALLSIHNPVPAHIRCSAQQARELWATTAQQEIQPVPLQSRARMPYTSKVHHTARRRTASMDAMGLARAELLEHTSAASGQTE